MTTAARMSDLRLAVDDALDLGPGHAGGTDDLGDGVGAAWLRRLTDRGIALYLSLLGAAHSGPGAGQGVVAHVLHGATSRSIFAIPLAEYFYLLHHVDTSQRRTGEVVMGPEAHGPKALTTRLPDHLCDVLCGWATSDKGSCICSCRGERHGSFWATPEATAAARARASARLDAVYADASSDEEF